MRINKVTTMTGTNIRTTDYRDDVIFSSNKYQIITSVTTTDDESETGYAVVRIADGVVQGRASAYAECLARIVQFESAEDQADEFFAAQGRQNVTDALMGGGEMH